MIEFQINKKNTKSLIGKWAKNMNRQFIKEEIQLVNKDKEKCLAPLVRKEIQIKSTK